MPVAQTTSIRHGILTSPETMQAFSCQGKILIVKMVNKSKIEYLNRTKTIGQTPGLNFC